MDNMVSQHVIAGLRDLESKITRVAKDTGDFPNNKTATELEPWMVQHLTSGERVLLDLLSEMWGFEQMQKWMAEILLPIKRLSKMT